MADFCMPALGADMEAGTLVEWKVKPGDPVKKGDLVATVETVKGAIEVEVFLDGVVEALLVEPGTTVPVGTPLARLREGDGLRAAPDRTAGVAPCHALAPAPAARRAKAEGEAKPPAVGAAEGNVVSARPLAVGFAEAVVQAEREPVVPRDESQALSTAVGKEPHARASPVARKMAQAKGVNLLEVHGSGPEGAVLKADVEAFLRARAEPRAASRLEPGAMRRAIGAAMARSKREIPHYYLATEVDLGRALDWMERRNADRPVAERLLPAALLLKAAVKAVRAAPEVNGTFDGDFLPCEAVHLGVAIHLKGKGLVAPALRGAQELPLDELMRRLTDLVTRARAGRLTASELAGQTLTVTNLGELGVTTAFPVIIPPQVAMVGLGKVQRRPWVVDHDAIGPRPIVVASLAGDHRVSDGLAGARYLRAFDEALQHPEEL